MTNSNPHLGSSVDGLLEADGVLAEAQDVAVKRVRDWRAVQATTRKAVATDDDVLNLPVEFETDEDGWVLASCPTLPGCHSQGRTKDEALANIREAVEGYLASMGTHGDATGGAFRLERASAP